MELSAVPDTHGRSDAGVSATSSGHAPPTATKLAENATTPRAAVRTVQEKFVQQTGKQLDRSAVEALSRLASAVEQERYAPRPVTPTSAELHRWLGTVKHAVDRELSGRSRRGAGPSAPRAGT